jgi:hypothetical protein
MPPLGEVLDEPGEHGSGARAFGGHLEQELPDPVEVLTDLVLDLLEARDGRRGIRLDPVAERLDLEDGRRHGLGQAVVDLHRPAGALLQQLALDGIGHRRMHALRCGR